MNRHWLVLAICAVLAASCGDTANPAAIPLNLDRPVDIAFACYGPMRVTGGMEATADQEVIVTAQPTASCDKRSSTQRGPDDPEPRPTGQGDTTGFPPVGTTDWYGFILESAQGTVALAHWPSQSADKFAGSVGVEVQMLDADPLTPGKNAISIGEEPIAIATDKSGCYEVTANAGSCDLSVLDINSALAGLSVNSTFDTNGVNPGAAGAVRVDRVPVKNQMGMPILARPAAMAVEPSTIKLDVIGNTCPHVNPQDPTSASQPTGVFYVAYPSCHLVAAIDMSAGFGTIVAAIRYDAGGPTLLSPADVASVSCPAECGPTPGAITPGARPVTLAYRIETRDDLPAVTRKLAIGADNDPAITLVEIGAVGDPPELRPASLSQIPLQNPTGKLGITSIALSGQLGMGGSAGDTNDSGTSGGQGQYVYAVATDNTVRVADVLSIKKECDTQIDPRFRSAPMLDPHPEFTGVFTDATALPCLPVGGPSTPPRRAGARGPGIELPNAAVPLSVAFFRVPKVFDLSSTSMDKAADARTDTPERLLGTFAVVTATDGSAFVVNVDDDYSVDSFAAGDDPQKTAPTLVMPHQLRDSIASRGQGAVASTSDSTVSCLSPGTLGIGDPRSTAAPLMIATGGPMAASKVLELPSIRQVRCVAADAPDPGIPVSELILAADAKTRDAVFPDLGSLAPIENWSLTWEGALSQDNAATSVDGPAIREAQMVVDSTASGRIDDPARPFCAMGAQPFDVLQIRGCNPTNQGTDCPLGYTCFVHPDRSVAVGSTTIGSCMRVDEAPRLANTCRDFLISLRRYTIGRAESGELVVQPRSHVLRTTPLDGCSDADNDAQCKTLADYAEQTAVEPGATVPKAKGTWQCLADGTRAPINPDPVKNKRCVQRCAFHLDNMDRDVECDPGMICQGATPGSPATSDQPPVPATLGVCMEGVIPPQACVNAPQRYEVRASEAFTVIGSVSGYVHPFIENPDKSDPLRAHLCVPDKTASRLQLGRLGLTAPACDPMADPISGELPSGGFEPNPCSLTTSQFETPKSYTSDNCALPEVVPPHERETPAPAIKFRNRGLTLTLVDPYYPGDRACPVDRGGSPDPTIANGRIPLVFPSYTLSFSQTAGLTPMDLAGVTARFAPAFPVKVVAGPTSSIWVLDDGDLLSTTLGIASTRGQVFRVEGINLGISNQLQ